MKFYCVFLLVVAVVACYVAAQDKIDPVQVEAKAQNSEPAAQAEGTADAKAPPKLQKRGLYGWGWGPGWGWGGYGWGHPVYYGWGGPYGYGWGWGGFFY